MKTLQKSAWFSSYSSPEALAMMPFILAILFVNFILIAGQCQDKISIAEFNALHDFFVSTNGSGWIWKRPTILFGTIWNFNNLNYSDENYLKRPCGDKWQGIGCKTLTSPSFPCGVNSINLNNYGLDGSIPSSISNLSMLQNFSLTLNPLLVGTLPTQIASLSNLLYLRLLKVGLNGTLPTELGNLVLLQYFGIAYTSMTGTLPTELGYLSHVNSFSIQNSPISGTIPSSLGNLTRCTLFGLNAMNLSGTFPSSLGNLQSLTSLSLFTNQITGTLPTSISSLTNLQVFEVDNNRLTGSIPTAIGLISGLTLFDLHNNLITGPVPSELCFLKKLTKLYLFINSLVGSIPPCLGNLVSLQYLQLDSNSLQGKIPESLGELINLLELDLFGNSLTGSIPPSLGNLSSIVNLFLFDNCLTGTIPRQLFSPSMLEEFDLYSNVLSGTIPRSLGTARSLLGLFLASNALTGTIPNMSNLTKLQNLQLDDNRLSNRIPTALATLKSLLYLDLSGNMLSGVLPTELTQLNLLQQLYCNNNILSGKLDLMENMTSFRVLNTLDVAENAFTGTLPDSLLSLPSLEYVAAGSNCFVGSLPCPSHGNSSSFSSLPLRIVDLIGLSSGFACRNYILSSVLPNPGYFPNTWMEGSIPSCLWSLPNLTTLYLGSNGLQGSIDVGNGLSLTTKQLINVSLSFNFLTGSIPLSLLSYGNFQNFDVSFNKLGGTLTDSFTTTQSSTFSLADNRLSGSLGQLAYLTANADVVTSILSGNMFTFDIADIDQSAQAAATLYLGSYEFDVAMIVTGCFVGACGMWAGWWWLQWRISTPNKLWHWWEAMALRNISLNGVQLRTFVLAVGDLARMVLCSGVVAVAASVWYSVLKVAPQLSMVYSTYEKQQGWTPSVIYLHDYLPLMPILVALLVLTTTTATVLSRSRSARTDPTDDGDEDNGQRRRGSLATLTLVAKSCLHVVINLTVLFVVNAAYLNAVLNNSRNLILIQAAVGMFKSVWSAIYIPFAMQSVESHNDDTAPMSQRFLLQYQILMLAVSFVIAPCLATVLTDSSCFYELFHQQSSPIASTPQSCPEGDQQKSGFGDDYICITSPTQSLSSSFAPPFMYRYQCGSALIEQYVPVLLYSLLSELVMTASHLLLLVMGEKAAQHIPRVMKRSVGYFPLIWFMGGDDAEEDGAEISAQYSGTSSSIVSRDSLAPFEYYEAAPVPVQDRDRRPLRSQYIVRPLFNSHSAASKLILHLIIMNTFGLATPFLAVVTMASFFSLAAFGRFALGRCIWVGEWSVVGAGGAFSNAYAVAVLEATVCDTGECLASCGWIVVVVTQFFWALLSFDMMGDVYGFTSAWQSMVTIFTLGIGLTYLVRELIWRIYGAVGWRSRDPAAELAHRDDFDFGALA